MPEVQGPDGQRYQFPEGTSPDVMRQAMAKRYPKTEKQPNQVSDPLAGISNDPLAGDFQLNPAPNVSAQLTPRQSTYNERVIEGLTDPNALADTAAAAISGINNLAYFGLDDEIAGAIGDRTGFQPLQQYETEQDRLRAERPEAFMGGQMAAGMLPVNLVTQPSQGILRNAFTAGSTNAAITLPLGYNDADAPGQNRLQSGLISGGAGGVFGALLGGGGAALSKSFGGVSSRELQAAAADLAALDGQTIRPQAMKAFNRLLSKSGLTDADILRLHSEVSNRQASLQGLPASAQNRKRTFQHYMEVLAEDEGSALYNPQAAANILMTVQERANNARPGDQSRGIVGAAVKADRASQVPFLEDSAQSISQGSRAGTNELVQTTRADLGSQYEAALDPSQITPQAQQEAMQMIQSIRPLLDGPSGLKVQAAAEGVDVDGLIAQNPMKALHWIQSAARRKAQSADPNRAAYASLRQRALPVIENNVPQYGQLRRDYASNEGIDKAKTFGDRLFGGAQSNIINNPGMRGEMVAEFQALTDAEKQIALVSIRDQALGKIAGGAEDAPARLSQLNTRNALDFLEQVGQKSFADDIRAIGRENQLLSVADAGNPLRQSATFSNAQARAEAPALYNGTIANAVDNSTPGTLLGEGMLMTFAPHYQGAYAAYRGGRLAAKAGFGTRKKTLEDMTRFLMSRPDEAPANAFTPEPAQTPTPQVANAFAPEAPVAAPKGEPVSNGLPVSTLTGAAIGGINPDLNQDGEVTWAERMAGIAGGAALGRYGPKMMSQVDDAVTSPATRQLLEGRANPQGLGSKGSLPMDEASRMARAKEMGFDTDQTLYHGTTSGKQLAESNSFELGRGGSGGIDQGEAVFLSSNPQVSNKYAPVQKQLTREEMQEIFDQGEAVISVDTAMKWQRMNETNPAVFPLMARGKIKEIGKEAITAPDGGFSDTRMMRLIDEAKRDGFEGLRIKGSNDGYDVPADEYVIFNPKNIRSKYAAFDPAQSESPVLTAGIGGPNQRRQTQDSIRDGLKEAGGRSRAPVSIETGQPVEQLSDDLRSVVDASTPIDGVRPTYRGDVSPAQARGQLRDDLLAQGDDPQQVDNLIELLGDDVVQVLRDRQLGPAVSRGIDSNAGDGGEGLGVLVAILGAGGAATAIQMAMRDSGNPRATMQDVMRALDNATRGPRGMPPAPSLKPANVFALQ